MRQRFDRQWSPSLILFAAVAGPLWCHARGETEICQELLYGVPEKSWCLVQSKRSIITVESGLAQNAWSDDSTATVQTPNLTTTAKPAENITSTTVENLGPRRVLRNTYIYTFTESSWAHIARFISEQWRLIIILFTLTFMLLFPGSHWHFNEREAERAMFAASFDEEEEGVSKFLEHIRVEPDGGTKDARRLLPAGSWRKWRRYAMLLLKLSAVGFNITMLVVMDRDLLIGAAQFYHGGSQNDLPTRLRQYLRLAATYNASLISVRHAAAVAIAELIGLSAMITWIVYRALVFILFRRSPDIRHKFDSFIAAFEAFDGFTLLGSFSALRLVSLSHPILIASRFQFHMVSYATGGRVDWMFQATWFVVTRMIVVFIGVIAFGVKLAFASVALHMGKREEREELMVLAWRWSVVVITLVQTLGAVSIERVLWNRVMFFIIAGGDGHVTLAKVQTANVYLSRLVQAIYDEFAAKGEVFNFLVVMLTFDHADLQFMLLDEEEGAADELVRKATKYFSRHRESLERLEDDADAKSDSKSDSND